MTRVYTPGNSEKKITIVITSKILEKVLMHNSGLTTFFLFENLKFDW